MRRTLVIGLLAALISTTILSPASAAIKAGSKCSVKGETKTSGAKTYTCTKTKGKLVWDKGVTTKKAYAIPTEELTFANVLKNYKDVSYWAWKKSSDKVEKAVPSDVKVTILKGPNTEELKHDPMVAINLTSRLFADYKQVSEFVLAYFTFDDVAWAQQQVDFYIGKNGGYDTSAEAAKMCQSEFICTSAAVFFNQQSKLTLAIMTAPTELSFVRDFGSGTREAHEYGHTIQDKQIIGKIPEGRQPPRWLTEGSAEYFQIASMYYRSFDSYLKGRKSIINDLHYPSNIDENWLEEFLNPTDIGLSWDNWDRYDGWRVYDVGFMVSEIMAAVGGSNSVMEIYKLMGEGFTYQESFTKTLGISWEEGLKIIKKVIAKELSYN
jgi:hypothetical protein